MASTSPGSLVLGQETVSGESEIKHEDVERREIGIRFRLHPAVRVRGIVARRAKKAAVFSVQIELKSDVHQPNRSHTLALDWNDRRDARTQLQERIF